MTSDQSPAETPNFSEEDYEFYDGLSQTCWKCGEPMDKHVRLDGTCYDVCPSTIAVRRGLVEALPRIRPLP